MRFPIGSLWKSYGVRLVAAVSLMAVVLIVGVVILLVQSCEDGVIGTTPPPLTDSN